MRVEVVKTDRTPWGVSQTPPAAAGKIVECHHTVLICAVYFTPERNVAVLGSQKICGKKRVQNYGPFFLQCNLRLKSRFLYRFDAFFDKLHN